MNAQIINTQLYAAALIRDGMRIALVRAITGVSKEVLRDLWSSVHGKDTPQLGRLPFDTIAFVRAGQSLVALSTAVSMYLWAEKEHKTPVEAFVIAWEASKLLVDDAGEIDLDINAAWYAIRDIKAGLVFWHQCKNCKAGFIFGTQISKKNNNCPYCGMSDTKMIEVAQ